MSEDGYQPSPQRWIALIVCCSAMFMTLLDVSVTNVALPSIGRATGAGPSGLQWVISGYTLAFGMVPVLAGRLGDDHGRRVMFQIGVIGFVATSALSGIAPSVGLLIAARVLQGVFGGLINPQVSGLVQNLFRGAERGRAFGVLGTTVGVGTALGPIVGGALIALGGPDWGWRLVFFVNIPIGVLVVVLARRLLPADVPGGKHRLDIAGALTLGAATFCILFAAVQYDAVRDARLAWLVLPAIVLLVVFWRRERRLTDRRADPLVDLRLFKQRSYTPGVLLAITFFPAQAGLPLVMALYYQDGLGYSALQSALGVTAFAAGSAIGAPTAGRFVVRLGRPLVIGAATAFGLGAAALALVAWQAPAQHATLAMALPLFVMGVSSGCLITPNQTLTLADVDPVVGSTAGGVLQTAQRIGLAIGQGVIGAVFFAAVSGHSGSTAYGHGVAAAVIAALCFVALAIVIGVSDLIRNGRHRPAGVGAR